MKTTLMFLMALGIAGAGFSAPADGGEAPAPGLQERQLAQESADADNLYDLVTQARADLREMRVASGLPAFASRPQAGRAESHEGGEGTYLPKMTKAGQALRRTGPVWFSNSTRQRRSSSAR